MRTENTVLIVAAPKLRRMEKRVLGESIVSSSLSPLKKYNRDKIRTAYKPKVAKEQAIEIFLKVI
jgi:hypothetical protein